MRLLQAGRRRIGRLLRLPVWVLAWAGPVWVLLGLAKALIVILPFKRLISYFGISHGVAVWDSSLTPPQHGVARRVHEVIALVARHTPWDSNCFPQALVAGLLLRLHGVPYAIHFGLGRKPDGAELMAHAWVAAGSVSVTGGPGCERYTAVGVFVYPRPSP